MRVVLGINAFGIGCIDVDWLDTVRGVDPVTVLSTNALLPSAVHPESAAAPATRPAKVTAFSALLETRLLISPLVRGYSMKPTIGA